MVTKQKEKQNSKSRVAKNPKQNSNYDKTLTQIVIKLKKSNADNSISDKT